MIKLSIIVPIYNVEKYLDKCIKSLLDQDFKNYEILLINDGSTDNSEALCLKYANKYKKKIKYFYKENGGLSSARNYGLERAVQPVHASLLHFPAVQSVVLYRDRLPVPGR